VRRLDTLCYAVVWIGAMALFLVPDAAPQLVLAFCLIIAPSRFLGGAQRVRGYRMAWRLITVAFILLSLLDWYGERRSFWQTLVAQMCFLQAYKAYNVKNHSDYLFMVLLAAAMVILGGMASESVFFLLILIPFVAFSAAFLFSLNLCRQYLVRRRRPTGMAAARVSAALGYQVGFDQLDVRKVTPPRRSWVLQSLAVLLIGAGLFYLLPREHVFPPPYFSPGFNVSGRDPVRSGLAGGVDLRHLSAIKNDPTPVLKVIFPSQVPPLESIYLRSGSLEKFADLKWSSTPIWPRAPRPDDSGTYWFRHIDPADQHRLIPHRVEFLRGPSQPVALPGLVAIAEVETRPPVYQVALAGQLNWVKRYTAFSWGVESPGSISSHAESEAPSTESLGLPREMSSLRIQRLAAEIAYGRSGNHNRARAIETYLRRRYGYTLDIERLNGPETGPTPLDRFLFDCRQGNCEVFASAMVVLCRNLGVPARLTIGYHGGIPGSSPREFVFRNQDAHAWVEAWSPEAGWKTFDPTPSPPLEVYSGRFSFKELMGWFNRATIHWRQLVISYDREAKATWMTYVWDPVAVWLFEPRPERGPFDRLIPRMRENLARPQVMALLGSLIAFNVAVAALYWRVRRRWQGRLAGRTPSASRRGNPWFKFYRAVVAALDGKLKRRPPSQTPGEFLEALARSSLLDPLLIQPIVELYHQGRFGDRVWDKQAARQAELLLCRLVQSVRNQ